MLQQYEVHTASSTSSDRCVELRIKPHGGVRTQSPRLSADRLQLSGDAGSDLETKKSSAPRARLSWLRVIREYAASSSHRAGLGCQVKRLGTSLRGQTVSQDRLERLSPGPSDVISARLFAAPDAAVVDVGLNFLSPTTHLLNHKSIPVQTKDRSTIPTSDFSQEDCFDARARFVFAT